MIKQEYVYSDNLDLLEETHEFMITSRNAVTNNIQMGLNYSIILTSVLILESKFERLLYAIVNYYDDIYVKYMGHIDIAEDTLIEKNYRNFLNNFFERTKSQISKNTGISHYKNMLSTLIDNYTPTQEMKNLEEGIEVLFQLRNVLAHGRAIRFDVKTYMPYPTYEVENVEVDFKGGYKKAEDYLYKHGLIEKKCIETRNFHILFTNEISNYFVDLQNKYIDECYKSIPFVIDEYL